MVQNSLVGIDVLGTKYFPKLFVINNAFISWGIIWKTLPSLALNWSLDLHICQVPKD